MLQNVVRISGWVSYSQEEKSCITVHRLTEYRNATVFERTSIYKMIQEKKNYIVFYRGYSFIFCGGFFGQVLQLFLSCFTGLWG